MRETDEDLRTLQGLLDRSAQTAGPHLRSIFQPERSLSAEGVAALFTGKRQAAVATVTARGEPRVAPVDVILLRGSLHFGTSVRAARIRHLRRRPGISLAYFERDELAVLVNGQAHLIEFDDPGFAEIDALFVEVYGGTPSTRDEGSVYVRVEAETMHTLNRTA